MKKLLYSLIFTFVCLLAFSSQAFADTHYVTNCLDSGAGSLRQTLTDVGTNDTVVFDITTVEAGYSTGESYPGLVTNESSGNTWFRIIAATSLPTISYSGITINGFSQTREASNALGPEIEIRQNVGLGGMGGTAFALNANNCLVKGFAINRFSGMSMGQAIKISANNCTVEGCYLGTDAIGNSKQSNYMGIYFNNANYCLVGGDLSDLTKRNIISGNTSKNIFVETSSSNEISGNYIGADYSGNSAIDSSHSNRGIDISNNSFFNIIGGRAGREGNLISGNVAGIYLSWGSGRSRVMGNFIGTTASGEGRIDYNADSSISFYGLDEYTRSDNNIVGSSEAGRYNVLAGPLIFAYSSNNTVEGNYFGTSSTETADFGDSQSNPNGIIIGTNSCNNIVGPSNVVANFRGSWEPGGIKISQGALDVSGNKVTRNSIYNNDPLGIILLNGANNSIPQPVISQALKINSTSFEVAGTSTPDAVIEIFKTGNPSPTGSGEGKVYMASTTANGSGNWVATFEGLTLGATLSATATDPNNNTSEFARNAVVNNLTPSVSISHPVSGDIATPNSTYPITWEASGGLPISINIYYSVDTGATYTLITSAISNSGTYLWSTPDLITTEAKVKIEAYSAWGGGTYVATSEGSKFTLSNTVSVTNCNDSGAGSLRQALTSLTAGGAITFNITTAEAGYSTGEGYSGLVTNEAGSDSWFRIMVYSALPQITASSVTINGFTQPTTESNNSRGPEIEIRARTKISNAALDIASNNCFVKGLAINGTSESRSDDVAFGYGIQISGNSNTVESCYIGTDAVGLQKRQTDYGVYIGSGSFNRIGGSLESQRNIISGNRYQGIYIYGTTNEVYGNYIGLKADGSGQIGNFWNGVYIHGNWNKIGSAITGEGNVISGNGLGSGIEAGGIRIESAQFNEVYGNHIGTDPTGEIAMLNYHSSIIINSGGYNKIGGANLQKNVLAAGSSSPIASVYASGSGSNEIIGNYIGVTASGEGISSNPYYGIYLLNGSIKNIIGGSASGQGNVIAGATTSGIMITSSNANEIYGNYIGTNKTGTNRLPNSLAGIEIDHTSGTKVGGVSAGQGNTISGNNGYGIIIELSSTNEIIGNYIGTNASSVNLSNTAYGIHIVGDSSAPFSIGNIIGPSNEVAYNGSSSYPSGICIEGDGALEAAGNKITQNSMHDNAGLGINLKNNGNTNIPAPVISISKLINTTTEVSGTSEANATIEVFKTGTPSSTGSGEGRTFVGYVVANGAGNWVGTFEGLPSGTRLTATQTDTNNNTSRFSINRVSGGVAPTISISSPVAGETVYNNRSKIITYEAACAQTLTINAYYSINNGSTYSLIASGLENTGQYSWSVPASIQTNEAKVKVEAIAADLSIATAESESFTIESSTISVTNCNDSGSGSLRYVVGSAEAGDQIQFNLTAAGCGFSTGESYPGIVTGEAGNHWFRIILSSVVTLDGNSLVVDGFSQPTSEIHNSQGPLIEIRPLPDGTNTSNGINITSNNCIVKGLVLNGFNRGGSSGKPIYITGSSNSIEGCYFGILPDGITCTTNTTNEISIYVITGTGNVIGGTGANKRNLISGSTYYGVSLNNTSSNQIYGNYFGTTSSGEGIPVSLSYQYTGAYLNNSSSNTIEANVFGKFTICGIDFTNGSSTNEIKNNYIGTDASQNASLGSAYGIRISSDQDSSNIIGPSNVIANNGQCGIFMSSSAPYYSIYNWITKNSIYNNSNYGISIEGTANEGVVKPVISYAFYDSGTGYTAIKGTCGTVFTTDASSVLEIFKADAKGQGRTYLGSSEMNAYGTFEASLAGLSTGDRIVATKTRPSRSTSSFSASMEVLPAVISPDNMITSDIGGSGYKYANVLESSPITQIVTQSAITVVTNEVVYYFKATNPGGKSDSFKVKGTGNTGSFTVTYFNAKTAGDNITSQVTTESGYTIPTPFAPGYNWEGRAQIRYTGSTVATKDVDITLVSATDSSTKDVVRAEATFYPPIYKPDNMVATLESGNDYAYENVIENFSTNPRTQVRNKTAITVTTREVTHYFKIINAGNTTDYYLLTGESLSGSFEVKYFNATSGGDEITSSVTKEGYNIPIAMEPGASVEGRCEIWYSGSAANLLTPEVKVCFSSTTETSTLDVVVARATFAPAAYQPDNMIGTFETGSDYATPHLYESVPSVQVRRLSKLSSTTTEAFFYYKFVNDGNAAEKFLISAEGDATGTFRITYYANIGGAITDITNYVTGETPFLMPSDTDPGATVIEGSAEVKYLGSINTLATKEITITIVSSNDASKVDVVKGIATFTPPVYQPDHMIATLESRADYAYPDVYESTPTTQIRRRNVNLTSTNEGTFYFKLMNKGNASDTFRVSGETSSGNFTVTYWNSTTESASDNNITSWVTGEGVPIPYPVNPQATLVEGRITVRYAGTTLATKEITTTFTSLTDPTKKDVVKGIVTFIPATYDPLLYISSQESGADYNLVSVNIATSEGATIECYLRAVNGGTTTDSLKISAETSSSLYNVTYWYNMGGYWLDFTSYVTGEGTIIPDIGSGEVGFNNVKCKARYIGPALSSVTTKEITATLKSVNDSTKGMTVKAIMTIIPNSTVATFDAVFPQSIIAGTTFEAQLTAKNSSGATCEVVLTTYLTPDAGSITPASIASGLFSRGRWTGNLNISKAGARKITITNGSAIATVDALVKNATQEISPSGVTGMKITVPAGAASTEVSLTVTSASNPGTLPSGFSLGGRIFEFTSNVTQFSAPVTVVMPITESLKDPKVYYWDSTRRTWSTDGITIVSCTSTAITFTTTHFTIFAPMGASATNLVRFAPNPYNANGGGGRFWYWLNSSGDTSIYIVDIVGNLVWKQTYPSGFNGGKAGENNVAFGRCDQWGSLLGNGVYIYKIVQGGSVIGGGKIGVINTY